MAAQVRHKYRPHFDVLEDRWVPTTVTTLLDTTGAGSLRAAIAVTPRDGTIDFAPGLRGTLALRNGPLALGRNVTIVGPGVAFVSVSAGNLSNVFEISRNVTVTISGLTITRSRTAGVVNLGTLTLADCLVTNNSQGGILTSGPLTVTGTTVSNNRGGNGGITATGTNLTVTNSTVSGNSGSGAGGIFLLNAQATLTNVTVAGNTASSGTDGQAGGGLKIGGGSQVTLNNTVIAGNTASGVVLNGPDVLGSVASANANLIGDGTGSSGLVNRANGNQVGTSASPIDPRLGPLQNNGGPTPTRALLPGSPAIAAGNPALVAGSTDQRGLARVVNGTTDVGAYERQPASAATGLFALGGAPGRVQVRRNSDGALLADFLPYGTAYGGGVSVAVGDVSGNGFPDIVTGATAGNPHVKIYSGAAFLNNTFDSANPDNSLLGQFFAYGLNFNVGANVAVGDVSGDGIADVVTGATAGNPHVKVYNGAAIAAGTLDPANPDASLLAQWFPYALQFNVGANVAVGDVNRDGFADVVTGATAGNPDVRVYDGKAIANDTFDPNANLLAQWFPYALQFNVGAFVAVGDVDGDGFGDVITGASAGNPDVRVYSGRAIAAGTFDPANLSASQLDQFFAFPLDTGSGVSVAAADFEDNGRADILTALSAGAPRYRVVNGLTPSGVMPPSVNGIDGILTNVQGGLRVGA